VIFYLLSFAKFHNREEELNNSLAAFKSKVWDLEISLREAEAGGQKLK
jgi:hypothetical protein